MSIPMICTKAHRRKRARAGTASIEFAILAPILAVILFGIVDYGMYVAQSSWLIAATRVGLEYMRVTNCISSNVCSIPVTSFVNAYTSIHNVTPNIAATTSAAYCTCPGSNPTAVGSGVTPCPPVGQVSPCNGNADARVFVYDKLASGRLGYKPLFTFGFFGSNVLLQSGVIRSQ